MGARPRRATALHRRGARALGISRRTLAHYAKTGQLEPTLVLPSGYYKWDLEDIRRQLRELREHGPDT
ncbi:MerR family transcriptional regulator [Pseudonocardia sp. CNS-004]|nr:MerR family transcriptional regulator [Pseudonocardia sp. CNS-004]